jgi:hypothetical protein
MEIEKIELILLEAWWGSDDYSIVFTNKRIYLIEHYKSLLELPSKSGMPGLAIGAIAHKFRESKSKKVVKEKDILKKMSLEEVQKIAHKIYNYSDVIKPTIKKRNDCGIIEFEITTGGRIIKTKWIELGFPIENFKQMDTYLKIYGFNSD